MITKIIKSSVLKDCWTAESHFDKCFECSRFDRCKHPLISPERREKMNQIRIKREEIKKLERGIEDLKK